MLGMTQIVAQHGRKSFLFGIEDADYGIGIYWRSRCCPVSRLVK